MNRSTSKTNFEVVYGIHPRSMCELREIGRMEGRSVHAKEFAKSMKEVHDQVKKSQMKANQKLKSKVVEKIKDV